MLYPVRVPQFIQRTFPDFMWKDNNSISEKIYLTFDDGPDPKSTLVLMDILEKRNVPASHFVIGKRAEKYHDLVHLIKSQNHLIANHGYNHWNGWKISSKAFLENLDRGKEVTGSHFFRPPYGRITWRQFNQVKKSNRVVLWTIMPWDFKDNVSAQKCTEKIVKHIRGGDIVVLHDQPTLIKKIANYLPACIDAIEEKGLRFGTIDEIQF